MAIVPKLSGGRRGGAALRVEPPATLRLDSGIEVPLVVRRSARARRFALRLSPSDASIELVVPERAALAAALAFMEARKGWVAARLTALPQRIAFAAGQRVPVLGIERLLVATGPKRGAAPFRLGTDRIEIAGAPEFFARRARDGLRALARTVLADKTRALVGRFPEATAAGRAPGPVSIGDPRARWGSCSPSGALRYSWRLILAPEAVLDYVVAHEVAHLTHTDHSRRFWQLVATMHPGLVADRAWLKRHGAALHRYG